MKKLISVIMVVLAMTSAAQAETTLIYENFGNTQMQLTGVRDNKDVYTIDSPTALAHMRKEITVNRPYRGGNAEIDGKLYTGSASVEPIAAHHTVSVIYAWNELTTNESISVDYVNERLSQRGQFQIYVGGKRDMSEIGSLWTEKILDTNVTGHYSFSAAQITALTQRRDVDFVVFQETNIDMEFGGSIDNILVKADILSDTPYPEPKFVVVEKEGHYTAQLKEGEANVSVFVNGESVGNFSAGLIHIGYLFPGDEIRLLADGEEADSINKWDWQSWDFNFADGSIVVYVEDPPWPGDETTVDAELHRIFWKGEHPRKKHMLTLHMNYNDVVEMPIENLEDSAISVTITLPDGRAYTFNAKAALFNNKGIIRNK